MEVNELRIGNYILNNNGDISTVALIGKYIVMVDNSKKVNEKDAQPIPLTQDWLAKFGFKDNQLDFFVLELDEDGVYWFSTKFDDVSVTSVHQLQNLYYAIQGQELTIKETV